MTFSAAPIFSQHRSLVSFSTRYRAHRDLPSFPTRRSSDLDELDRLESFVFEPLRGGHGAAVHAYFAFAAEGCGDVGQRRQVTACAHGAFCGDAWQDPLLEHEDETFCDHGSHAAFTLCERLDTCGKHPCDLLIVEHSSGAAAVKAQKVQREFI